MGLKTWHVSRKLQKLHLFLPNSVVRHFARDVLKTMCYWTCCHLADKLVLVVFAVWLVLQLALVATSPSLPTRVKKKIQETSTSQKIIEVHKRRIRPTNSPNSYIYSTVFLRARVSFCSLTRAFLCTYIERQRHSAASELSATRLARQMAPCQSATPRGQRLHQRVDSNDDSSQFLSAVMGALSTRHLAWAERTE